MKIRSLGIDVNMKNLHIKEILFLTLTVFYYRELITWFYGEVLVDPTVNFLAFIALTIRNVPLTISLIWFSFVVSRKLSSYQYLERQALVRTVIEIGHLLIVSALAALVVNFSVLFKEGFGSILTNPIFFEQFLSVLAFDSVVYYGINVILYFRRIHKAELDEQINKRNRVNYQYSLLKQQLNPHFLFNSLNVLDYLVKTDPDRASQFINKLADVYRYQLNQEQKESVPLSIELRFVESYVSLLKERFAEAIVVNVDIESDEIDRYRVIPCALQLLVENAVKHNVVSDSKPLKISIKLINGWIVTTNNVNPKYTKVDSWGIGLKSITEQYQTVFGEQIEISENANSFSVALPLVEI